MNYKVAITVIFQSLAESHMTSLQILQFGTKKAFNRTFIKTFEPNIQIFIAL